MSLNESHWISIAALAVQTVISVSRWSWDARKETRSSQAEVSNKEVADIPNRPQKPKSGWWGSALPFCILGWHTVFGGALTRFDFGIMIFAVCLIVGNWALWLGRILVNISDSQVAHSRVLSIIVKLQSQQNEENEQDGGGNGG